MLDLAIGRQMPPVASTRIVSCAITKPAIWKTGKDDLPFIAALVVARCIYVPHPAAIYTPAPGLR